MDVLVVLRLCRSSAGRELETSFAANVGTDHLASMREISRYRTRAMFKNSAQAASDRARLDRPAMSRWADLLHRQRRAPPQQRRIHHSPRSRESGTEQLTK